MKWYIEVLKKYAVFTGRARRSEYWYFFLFNVIISMVIGFIEGATGLADPETGRGMLGLGYSLALLVPGIAVGVRRMHDTGHSGWYLLIPFYNLYLAVSNGDVGSNEYGPDPKNPDMELMDHLVED